MSTQGRKFLPWLVGASVAVAIFASILLLSSAVETQRRTGDAIRNHLENTLWLQRTQGLLVDAETGQRGFLLTSDKAYLSPYERAVTGLPNALSALNRADVVGPNDRLEVLALAKMHELAQTLALVRDGQKDAALALVEGGAGKTYMDEIRTETGRLTSNERQTIETEITGSERDVIEIYSGLILLILSGAGLLWWGLAALASNQRLETEATVLREVALAQGRTALVARELNHRVKNLFSIVLAIIHLASRGASTPKEAVDRIRDRVQALARAHEVSLGGDPLDAFDFETMLRTLLAPYAANAAELKLDGPSIQLPVMRVTPLGLIIHELATNSVKYGAWSSEKGKVDVSWSVDGPAKMNGSSEQGMLRFRWHEHAEGPLKADGKAGFGSQLINAAVAQLNGSITRERGDHGLTIFIDAPIVPTSSDGSSSASGDSSDLGGSDGH